MKFLIPLLVLFSLSAFGDEMPQPECNGEKTLYSNDWKMTLVGSGPSTFTEEFMFCDESDTSIKFWFSAYGQNGHMCFMAGEATKSAKSFSNSQNSAKGS